MDLEKELTCSICTDLLYQPLTLLDCLHTFCGACLKEWFGWQALAAETSPVPPAPTAAIFTCPSCRDAVRSTKHNATVATLLDMFLTAHPDKRKPDDEKAEMDSKYRPGDNVLPKVRRPKRSHEQQRLDAAEQHLIDEVREISRREAVAAAESAAEDSNGGGSSSAQEARQARRRRVANESIPRIMGHQSSIRSLISNSQDISSSSGSALDIEEEIAAFARQIEEEGILDGLDLDNIDINNDDELNRRIADAYERRQRGRSRHNNAGRNEAGRRDASRRDGSRHDGDASTRHRASSSVSHSTHSMAQPERSSGRSTLGVSSAAASRPPSSSARPSSHRRSQSQSSHRSRSSTGGGRRSAHAAVSDGASSNTTVSVPAASSAARTPSSAASGQHLEVRDDTRRHHQRRRTTSEGRSTSLPISGLSPGGRPTAAHSQTDLPLRPAELPGTAAARQSEARSTALPSPSPSSSSSSLQSNQNASPTSATAASFQARAMAMGLSGLASQGATTAGASRASMAATSSSEPVPIVAAHLAMSPVAAETHELPALAPPTPFSLYEHSEPDLHCSRCARKHIQYEVHYNCSTCSNGNWNICLRCYRDGKGCRHWFGFGHATQTKWEKKAALWRSENPAAAANGASFPPPHTLTANRYLRPRNTPSTTADDPQSRLQSGAFCARCQAWANSCFWHCDVCNEGDWGFCNECVNQGFACTHPLLPLTQQQHGRPSPPPRPRAASDLVPSSPSPGTTMNAVSACIPWARSFRPLDFTTTCDVCRKAIPPNSLRFHCYSCKSNVVPDTLPGDYDICQGCYGQLVVARPPSPSPSPDGPSTKSRPAMAPENGPNGWRRCPTGGHRMVIVAFLKDAKGGVPRRVVREDLVGGFRLETEPVPATAAAAVEAKKRGVDLESWYVWYAEKKMFERFVSRDVRKSAGILPSSPSLPSSSSSSGPAMSASAAAAAAVVNQPFPPLGGVGYTAIARWAYYPEPSKGNADNDDDAAADADADADDELPFPRHAEIREVEDVNGEWFHGVYMGRKGLFPSSYVRLKQHSR